MSETLFITRKRKKWKFAHFDQWSNCMQASDVKPGGLSNYFDTHQPLIVEVGAGTADLSCKLARLYPERNFIAIDVKSDRLYAGAKAAQQDDLRNILFVRAQLRQVRELFEPGSIDELWVTFPDPFPRVRQAKHRLTHPAFLRVYGELLKDGTPGARPSSSQRPSAQTAPQSAGNADVVLTKVQHRPGILRFKTDNRELFLWSLEQLVAEGWVIRELAFDLHKSDLPDDYKATTYYERKFMAHDISINYVSACPPGDQSSPVGRSS